MHAFTVGKIVTLELKSDDSERKIFALLTIKNSKNYKSYSSLMHEILKKGFKVD